MARPSTTPWPTTPGSVFFGDAASGATLSRAVAEGRIRRLARGVFTADMDAAPPDVIARNRWAIIARLMPDALIADRSAAEGGMPSDGLLTVVSQQRKSDLVLPGLTVAPRSGAPPLHDDPAWAAGLRITSDARTLVDNLALARGRAGRLARTLSRAELEDWVVRTVHRRPPEWLAALRARALELCDELGVPDRRPAVEDIVGMVAGTREARHAGGRLLAARAAGHEYDHRRVERFDELSAYLADIPTELGIPAEVEARPHDDETSLPFFEAYFSNFIEGTEFSVDEAEAIVASGEIPATRPEDAHDVLGTFEAVRDPDLRAAVPRTADELFALLERPCALS